MKPISIGGWNIAKKMSDEKQAELRAAEELMIYELKDRIRSCIPYFIRRRWDSVRWFFFPRQQWLIDKIPNSWVDKDTLWEICILEGIKHYVEQDGGLGFDDDWRKSYEHSQNDPTYPEWQKETDRQVYNNYRLITERIPDLEKKLEEAWDKIPPFVFPKTGEWPKMPKEDYDTKYGEIDRLEKEIHDIKTGIMVWAIKNREKIWS